MYKREATWHQKLGCLFSVDFWRKSWKLVAGLKHENKLRWFQYQIVRNVLKTNYIVNKMIPHVSHLCYFCGPETNEPETTLHLFWACGCVRDFWQELTDFTLANGIFLPFERNKIIFGIHNEPPNSVNNIIMLSAKYYIWSTKFRETRTHLSLNAFLNILKCRINDIINMAKVIKDDALLEEWNNVLLLL